MADPVLECKGIAKAFGAHKVLKNVDFSVGKGEIVGLLGPNGSGKSTLLNIISGFQTLNAGQVLLHGSDITSLPAHEITGHGLARTFQLPSMPQRMTVRQVVRAGSRDGSGLAEIFRRNPACDADVDQLLSEFMLDHVSHLPASSLSGGQKKLLSIATALRARPKLLCLDEPTAGVHPQLRTRMVALLKALNLRGVGILVVEHDMQFIKELCSRCVVLDRGEIVASCAPKELVNNDRVVEAYLGKAAKLQQVMTS